MPQMGSQFALFTHTSVLVKLLNLDSIVQLEIIILILTVRSTRLLSKYSIIKQWIKAN